MRIQKVFSSLGCSNERGVTLAEQAVLMPLWISIVFLLRDVFFIGYTWASLQYSVNEGLRLGIIGIKDPVTESSPLSDKKANICDNAIRKILANQLRMGIINPGLISPSRVESDPVYAQAVLSGLAASDSTAYSDIMAAYSQTMVRDFRPSTLDNTVALSPVRWWLSVDARRTLKASEGKLTPVSAAILKLTLGAAQLTLKAHADGRLEKPLL